MNAWRSTLLVTYLLASLVVGKENTPVSEELAAIATYQHGLSALANFLPEQAAKRFETARTTQGLSPSAQIEINMRIAECHVRAGKGSLALPLFKNKDLLKHPQAAYWKAQALAASGQFEAASEAFSEMRPDQPFYENSLLSNARLQQSLGNQEEAFNILTKAIETSNPEIQFPARMTLAEIELDAGNIELAKEHLDQITDSATKAILNAKNYLLGRCYLAENEYDQALALFDELQTSPPHISQRIFHGSALAKANTHAAKGDTQEALNFLTTFIDEHPDSFLLVTMIERLAQWMPQNPAPNHPVLLKLQEWSLTLPTEPTTKVTFLPGTAILKQAVSPDSLKTIEPSSTIEAQFPDLAATSLYHLALLTSTQEIAGAQSRALTLLAYLRAQYPTHILSQRSLLDTAKIQLEAGHDALSLNTLEILQANVISPSLQQNAAFIQGQIEVHQEEWGKAREAFTKASESLDKHFATAALINAGSAALREGGLAAFDQRYSKIDDEKLRTQLSLEKALWMHRNSHPEARTSLDQFLNKHHKHPRHAEVRLALAAAFIESEPIETIRAETELQLAKDSITSKQQIYEFARIKIRIAELESNWEDIIQTAEAFLQENPEHPDSFHMNLRLGEAMIHNGALNQARQVLGKLAFDQPAHPLSIYATFYNAMAARGENTPQSLLEAIEIFQTVIDSEHNLKQEAVIQQARILIDLGQLDRAKASLQTSYANATLPAIKQDLGILLADANRRQLGQDPNSANIAIEIYSELLKQPGLRQSSSNKLHSFLGETYESIGRLDLALDIYLNVINHENTVDSKHPTQEWHWYYECAFDALTILQEEEQWRSAVAIAKEIAASGGPREKEALAIAQELSIKHMIWETE